MDVDAVGEGLTELRDVGDVGEHAQLDLAVVGRDDLVARLGDEGGADLAPRLGADRDVLQVRFRRGQPAGRRRGERVAGVHPAGLRVHVGLERVGVGRFQLRELAPFEQQLRQRVPFRRQILEHVRAGRPLPGRGLAGAGQAHLAEQHVADLLRRAGRELLAGDLLDLGLEPGERLGEIARQPRQDLPVDGDAAHLHAGDHVDERALEAVVDLGAPLGGKARLEEQPQPERHVGLLGRIRGRLVDRHAVEADGGLAGAGDRLEVDGRVPEVAVGELGHGVAGKAVTAGVEHVGDEEGVVDGRDIDAVALQHHPVGLDVVADLEDGAVLEHGLQPRDHVAGRELARREPAAEKIVLAAMPERHIAGLARRERERHADEIGPVRIERIGLGVEGEDAGFARPGEDGVELLERGDAAIRLGVERDLGDLGRALGGKRCRHHHGCRLALARQRHPPRSCRRGPARRRPAPARRARPPGTAPGPT